LLKQKLDVGLLAVLYAGIYAVVDEMSVDEVSRNRRGDSPLY